MDFVYILKTLIPSVITGGLVAWVTAKFALNRFYNEKWWEKSQIAFVDTIENVYKIKRANDYFYQKFMSEQHDDEMFESLSKEEEDNLHKESHFATQEITRIQCSAALILTTKSASLIETYLTESAKIRPLWWVDAIDTEEAWARECMLTNTLLTELIDDAKDTLKKK
ncbi:hypothetical protein PHA77_09105 [Edwardsiella tarda]|uniref:hypothetical protein n=1 Tax=Edwardsiella tarda TaxID=636 RepID=UPI00244455CB|nr:hypothetical protein [Edwardsiella tarda]WGE27669.1 hypothetical protein PHA77_09105 [Edwardsiella tarda]